MVQHSGESQGEKHIVITNTQIQGGGGSGCGKGMMIGFGCFAAVVILGIGGCLLVGGGCTWFASQTRLLTNAIKVTDAEVRDVTDSMGRTKPRFYATIENTTEHALSSAYIEVRIVTPKGTEISSGRAMLFFANRPGDEPLKPGMKRTASDVGFSPSSTLRAPIGDQRIEVEVTRASDENQDLIRL